MNRNIVQKSKLCTVYKIFNFNLYFKLPIRHFFVENDTIISSYLLEFGNARGPNIQLLLHVTIYLFFKSRGNVKYIKLNSCSKKENTVEVQYTEDQQIKFVC